MDRSRHFLESSLLMGTGSLVAYFYYSQKLAFFIAPAYNELVLGAGLFCIALGTLQLLNLGKDHFHPVPIFRLLLCALPILLGIFLTPQPLSSETAKARGLSSQIANVQAVMPSFGVKPEDRRLIDWIQLMNFDPEPSHYEGQKVKVDGFVSFADDLPQNTFFITRFTLNCCAADARPIQLMVRVSEEMPIKDQWIQVEGIMQVEEINGERKNVVSLENWEKIPVPINPYAN